MADFADPTRELNLVAIDIARYANAVLVETEAGKRHRFKMANTAADFERLIATSAAEAKGITDGRFPVGSSGGRRTPVNGLTPRG